MIIVYDKNETSFTHNGLAVLNDCKSCLITEELNGQYELEIEYPLTSKCQYLTEENIIKADGQLFRIYHRVKTLNSVKVNVRHIFYDLIDNFLENVKVTNMSGFGALDYVLSNTEYPHNFICMGDVSGSNTVSFIRKNPIEAILGTDGIIAVWGGELVRDNFTVKLLNSRGQDRSVLISYGKNIIGIEETLDIDGVCTRLMPVGKDGLLLSEKYIDSPYINSFSHPKIKEQEFYDCETETELRASAEKFMQDNKIDIPMFNYKIDFLELSKTEEYKNYAVLETVYMGDTVTIKHNKLNISLKAKVIKMIKNAITNRIEQVELGGFKANFALGINNSIQNVKTEIVDTKNFLQTSIDNATAQITSALGGYVVKRNGELLIMDTEDVNTATKVWRWNQNGLGYSGTGYNGEFRTAITADGHIVADFMDTGKLSANIIQAGILKSLNGKVQFNLDGGTLRIGNDDTDYYLYFDGDTLDIRMSDGASLSSKITELSNAGLNERQSSEVLQTAQKISLKVSNEALSYRVVINSSEGSILKNGVNSTVLSATVFRGIEDITNLLDNSVFSWTKNSGDEASDSSFNAAGHKGKSITINDTDFNVVTDFICSVSFPISSIASN